MNTSLKLLICGMALVYAFCMQHTLAQNRVVLTIPVRTVCEGQVLMVTANCYTSLPVSNFRYMRFVNDQGILDTGRGNPYDMPLIFEAPGNYQVRGVATLTNGAKIYSNPVHITVRQRPRSFRLNLITNDRQCYEDNLFILRSPDSAARVEIDWNDAIMDQMISPPFEISHVFNNTGVFNCRYTVTDMYGCAFDSIIPVLVYPQATSFYLSRVDHNECFRTSVTFVKNPFLNKYLLMYKLKMGNEDFFEADTSSEGGITKDMIVYTYHAKPQADPVVYTLNTYGCSSTYNMYKITRDSVPNYSQRIVTHAFHGDTINRKHFMTREHGSKVFFSIEHEPSYIYTWQTGDPESAVISGKGLSNIAHNYVKSGVFPVSCKVTDPVYLCDTIFYDTIRIEGIRPRIETPAHNIALAQKYQVYAEDTVDFINNSTFYSQGNGLKLLWDFDDRFAPQCTSFSVPHPGAVLPFTTAAEQEAGSTHYYRYNGVVSPGRMNCRWSLDSLPRHKYTNWDSVYNWYINGHSFPPAWGLPDIPANAALEITPETPVPDPFWLAKGRQVYLTSGIIRNRYDSVIINDPIAGTFKRYANETLPGTGLKFHELVFRYVVTAGTKVKLQVMDTLPHFTGNYDSVLLFLGKPLAYGMDISGSDCAGTNLDKGEYINFQLGPNDRNPGTLPSFGQRAVFINFDSLADRNDQTPCLLDGFGGYAGGLTPGGLTTYPFSTHPGQSQHFMWKHNSYNKLVIKYGGQDGYSLPADHNGFITIGLLTGNGCANPPLCTEPLLLSDTVWYSAALHLRKDNSFRQNATLLGTGKPLQVIPEHPFVDDVKSDSWFWGDGELTVDSFWYANNPVSDGFFTSGFRRVRYHYHESGALIDSIVNPEGVPATAGRYYTSSYIPQSLCGGMDRMGYSQLLDSAKLLLPLTHHYKNNSIGLIHVKRITTGNSGCMNHAVLKKIVVGKYVHVYRDSKGCVGQPYTFIGDIRYFNPEAQSDGYGGYYYPLDETRYWRIYDSDTTEIRGSHLDPETGKMQPVYNERIFWDFNLDGITDSTGQEVSYIFGDSGLHLVNMIYRDSLGNLDTLTLTVHVMGPLNEFITAAGACESEVLFKDTDLFPGTCYWTIDGVAAGNEGLSSFVHHFSAGGKHTVLLKKEFSCTRTFEKELTVGGLIPRFEISSEDTVCAPYEISVRNTSQDLPGVRYFILWDDAGNPEPVSQSGTVTHIYNKPGNYQIQMIAEKDTADHCSFAVWPDQNPAEAKQMIIPSALDMSLSGEKKPLINTVVKYRVVPHMRGSVYKWNVSGGVIMGSSVSDMVEVIWNQPGTFKVSCDVITPSCKGIFTMPVVAGTTGVNANDPGDLLQIHPNPAAESVNIFFDDTRVKSAVIKLFDQHGKLHYTGRYTGTQTVVPLEGFSKGIYMIALESPQGVVRKKLVIR